MNSDLVTSFWILNSEFFAILATAIAASGVLVGIAEMFAPLLRRL